MLVQAVRAFLYHTRAVMKGEVVEITEPLVLEYLLRSGKAVPVEKPMERAVREPRRRAVKE